MGFRKTVAATFVVCAYCACLGFAGTVCAPGLPLGGLVRPLNLDDVRMCELRKHGLDHGNPLCQTCMCCDNCCQEGGYRLINDFLCKALLNNFNKKGCVHHFDADAVGLNLILLQGSIDGTL